MELINDLIQNLHALSNVVRSLRSLGDKAKQQNGVNDAFALELSWGTTAARRRTTAESSPWSPTTPEPTSTEPAPTPRWRSTAWRWRTTTQASAWPQATP